MVLRVGDFQIDLNFLSHPNLSLDSAKSSAGNRDPVADVIGEN